MRMVLAALLLATAGPAVLLGAVPARAAAAAEAFRAGRFEEAAKLGRAEATVQSLIYAGRATLNLAGYTMTSKDAAKAALAVAERDFDSAIAKAPNNLEARIQKAITTGYRAKLDKSPGAAKETRKLMEAVLARDPNYALGNAALGGWHGGAVATLGGFVASTVLGANRKDAERHFAVALAREPKNIIHPVTYAFTLLDLGAGNAPKAAQLLRTAVALPVADAYDGQNRKGAAAVLALIDKGDAKGARTLAKRIQPFGAVG